MVPEGTPSRRRAYPRRLSADRERDSDATLILTRGELRGGTLLTQRTATRLGRPCLAVDLNNPGAPAAARGWLIAHGIRVLNVAGPRESQSTGIAALATRLLRELLGAKPLQQTGNTGRENHSPIDRRKANRSG
jgi:hypothetical protein